MIDNVMYFIQIILIFICLISIRNWSYSKSNGLLGLGSLGTICFTMGITIVTGSNHPWNYLIFEANKQDWIKALIGGLEFLTLPFFLYMFIGKDIARLINNNNS